MALTVNVGETHTLTNAEGLGQGVGSIPTGTQVTVEELHEGPIEGVGGDVVVAFEGTPVEVDGEQIVPTRRVALSLADFARLFSNSKSGDTA